MVCGSTTPRTVRQRGAPDHVERPERLAEAPQVLGPRAEVVVDEHRVRLAVGPDLVLGEAERLRRHYWLRYGAT